MKKSKIFMILSFVFAFILSANVFASTNTEVRTADDLKIRSDITVNSTVREAALSTPKVDASEKVYDFADLLTDEEEQDLYEKITKFINKTKMDMVIVTIDENNKNSSMDYADDFYDYNDFGVGSNHDGILFLIDMDKRNMWISTTGKAIQKYSDAKIDSILDSTYDRISVQDYYGCAKAFINDATPKFPIIQIVLVCLTGTAIFIGIACSKHKTVRKAVQAKQYLDKDSFKLTENEDRFVTTHTSKVYDPPSSSGGGSSRHSSSSGSSHGGGGRSF